MARPGVPVPQNAASQHRFAVFYGL
jgi:hypothetical protein